MADNNEVVAPSNEVTVKSKPKRFDLGAMDVQAAAAKGAWMEIRHPSSNEPLGMQILVVGYDSQEYRDTQRRVMELAQKDGRKNADATVFERRGAEFAAAITMGWRYDGKDNFLPWNGGDLPFTDENAVNLYLDRRWIREQVETFASQRANFFPE